MSQANKTIPLPQTLKLNDKLISPKYRDEVVSVCKIDDMTGRIKLMRDSDHLVYKDSFTSDTLVEYDYKLIVYEKE